MICKKCGELLDDGSIICSKCGVKIEEQEAVSLEEPSSFVADEETVPVSDVAPTPFVAGEENVPEVAPVQPAFAAPAYDMYEEPQMPKKKASKKVWVFSTIGVVLVAAVTVVALNFQAVSNWAMKLVMSPEEYYQYIEAKELERVISDYVDLYDLAYNSVPLAKAQSIDYQLELEFGEYIYALLGTTFDIENPENFSRIDFDYMISLNDNQFYGEIAAGLGGNHIISANGLMDYNSKAVYAQVPDLSKKYFATAFTEEEAGQIRKMMSMNSELMKVYPDSETLEVLLNRYAMIFIENVINVAEAKETLSVEEIEQKSTVLTVSLTEKEMLNIAEQMLTTVKEDEELTKIMVELFVLMEGMEEAEAREFNLNMLDEELAEIAESKELATDETQVNMCIWVDNKGKIIGRRLEVVPEEVVLSYQMPQKGKEFGLMAIYDDSYEAYEVIGKGTKNIREITGEFDLLKKNTEGNEVELLTLSIDNLVMRDANNGEAEMKMTIEPNRGLFEEMGFGSESMLLDNYQLIYEGKASASQEDVVMSIVDGDDLFMKVSVSVKLDAPKDITVPTDAVMVETDEDMYEWMKTLSFDTLIGNMRKAGLPEEWIKSLEETADKLEMLKNYY